MESCLCSTTTYMELISFFFPLEIIDNHDGFLHLNLLSHKIICSAATLLLCPYCECYPVLCSDRAQWPLVPTFCSRTTSKSQFFSYKLDAGHRRFYSFRNPKTVKSRLLAFPQFSLEHNLVISFYTLWLLQFVNLCFVSMPIRSC